MATYGKCRISKRWIEKTGVSGSWASKQDYARRGKHDVPRRIQANPVTRRARTNAAIAYRGKLELYPSG